MPGASVTFSHRGSSTFIVKVIDATSGGPIQPATRGVFADVGVRRIDVLAVYPDGWRTRETDPGGNGRIGCIDQADRGARRDLGDHLLEDLPGGGVVRAVGEPEEFDPVGHDRSSVASTRHDVNRSALARTIDSPIMRTSRIRSSASE